MAGFLLAPFQALGAAYSVIGPIASSTASMVAKGASTVFGRLGGGARLMSSVTRTIATTTNTRVVRANQGFIRPGISRVTATVKGAATGSLKTAATANTILRAGYSLVSAIQSFLVLIFVYLIVNNINNIVQFILWLFSPIAAFMAFVDDSLNGARDMLRKKSYDPSLTSKDPSRIDWAVAGFLLFIEFLVFCVQEAIVLVSVLSQTAIAFVKRIASRPLFWLLFGIFLVISAAAEHNYIDIADMTNSVIVAGEAGTRQLFRAGNIGLDIYDAVAPFQNVALLYTIGKMRVLCDTFCPEPFKSSPTGRRLLEETPEELVFKYEKGGGRRRLIDTNTMRTKIKKIKKVVNKLAFGSYIMNLIDLRITALYLVLAKPLMEALSVLSGPIERLVSKIYCAMVGGFKCSFLEVFYFIVVAAVDFINSNTILKFPFPGNFACKAGELVDIDPAQCGNWLDAAKPPGSFFSALVPEGATQIGQRPRSLGAVYANVSSLGSDDTGEEYPLLECKQHPVDNSWVETLDGNVIHMSQYNKCPLSRHVFGDEFSNVKQFNMMGVDTECYVICLHDVKYESCHNQYTGHVRRLLGSCSPTTVPIENEQQARRRLNSLFPETYFGWSELFEGKKATTFSPVEQSPYSAHFHPNQKTMNSEDLVTSLKQSLRVNPKFTVFGIECDVRWEASIERVYTNVLCIGLRMVSDYGPSMDSLFFAFNNQQQKKRGRSLMDEQTDKLKSASFKKWSADLKKNKDAIMDTVSMARSYIRLLHATDKTQSMEDRIDEMIDVANYQSRRTLDDTASQVQGFDEPIVRDIGWCQGEDMFPCPKGPCVPIADRDLCPEPDMNSSDTSYWQIIGHYMNRASTIDFDPEEAIQDINQCYRGIDINTESNPVTLTNLEQEDGGSATYCTGLRPPFPYRFPDIEIKGINRFIASGCVVDDVNSCTCDFYYRPLLNYDLLTFYYTDADLQIKFINFFTWMHHLAYVILFIRIQWFQDGWYGFITWMAGGPQRLAPWVLYFFGDWGIRASIEKQWYCWGLHSNSAMTIVALLVLTYDLVKSLDVLSYWFWSLVRRITYYHHPLFWPKPVKTVT